MKTNAKLDRLLFAVLDYAHSWTFSLDMLPYQASSRQDELWRKWCSKRDKKRYTLEQIARGRCEEIPAEHTVMWNPVMESRMVNY